MVCGLAVWRIPDAKLVAYLRGAQGQRRSRPVPTPPFIAELPGFPFESHLHRLARYLGLKSMI
jgi:hypothetical protein